MKKLIAQNLLTVLIFFVVIFILNLAFTTSDLGINEIVQIAKTTVFKSIAFIVIMGILEAIYIKKNNIPVAKFGINPTQSAVFEVGMSMTEAKEIIALTIPGMIYSSQFKYDQENDLYKARTRSSLFSWGERVIIRLTEFDQSKLQLSVSSKPVLKTTIVDFGKSAVNIHNIKWAFKQA